MRHDFLKAFARFFYCFRTIYILLSHNGSILQVGRWPPCHVLPEIIYFASKPLIHQAQFLQVLLKLLFINGIVLQRRAIVVYRLWRVRQNARNLCTFSNITVIKLFILRSFQKKRLCNSGLKAKSITFECNNK